MAYQISFKQKRFSDIAFKNSNQICFFRMFVFTRLGLVILRRPSFWQLIALSCKKKLTVSYQELTRPLPQLNNEPGKIWISSYLSAKIRRKAEWWIWNSRGNSLSDSVLFEKTRERSDNRGTEREKRPK